ncbi:hypothetical protein Q5L94_04685 [Idiomarina sp. Sol25]|uniref:hypothetical protein n=1 Tax=Idiomarina sp. Sol25 TaxID=3064000 RepID=UPI00294ABC5A|nr:hypothetical protein [Idiomarina sp. Sol25]MDV6327344.1 hypothetical protein [Idiomarina sp. Sol25]
MKSVIILAGTALTLLFGCSNDSAKSHNTEVTAESEQLEATVPNIRKLIGVTDASNVESCKLLKVGHKSCGGPELYLVYSSENVENEAQLLDLVRRYNSQSKSWSSEGKMSNCQFIPRPEVELVGGQCRAVD